MPDNKSSSPQPSKAQLAGYIRSVNPTAKNLSDDEIVDKLVSKQPKIGKMVSDYSNPSLQGPVPQKNKFPMISDINRSVGQMGQAMPEKTLEEDFQDLEIERAKAAVAKNKYNTPVQPGGFNKSIIDKEQKAREDAINYEQRASSSFEKFKTKYNSDEQIQSLKNNAFSTLNDFTAEDNLGGTYVDNKKVRNYVRKSFPQAANTQFEDYIVQNISSDLLFKTKEPKIKEKVLKLAKEKNINIPENFLDLNSEIVKNAQKISDKATNDLSKINSNAETDITNINTQYKGLTDAIAKQYSDKDFIAQNFQSEEDYKKSYQSEMSQAFDNYSREFSRVKSNYMLLSQRLQGDYKRSIDELQVNTEKQKSEIGKLLKQSLMDLNEEDNQSKLKNFKLVSGAFDNMSLSPMSSKFILSLNSGLTGNWLNSVATNIKMGSNSQIATDFQDFTSNLSKKLSIPNSEIKSIKDLVDPTKFAISSGQMIGQMLPAIGVGVGTAYATGGTGLIPMLASGTIGWFDEASQARASNYQSMIEQGLDPEEAKNRANNTYSGYLASYPLALVESAAIFGKFGKGSMLRRIVTNIAADIPSETIQEISQNEADESIVMNRPMDFGQMFDLNNVYKTALNVAPASIVMPIPGSAIQSMKENEPVSLVGSWALRVSTAPIHSMAQNVLKNGLYANMAVLETMRHNGVITEEGMNQMKAKFQEVSSDMEAGKAAGLNKKQQTVYAGLMGNVRSMEESAAQLANQEMSEESKTQATEVANKRIENTKNIASDYLNTKNGNFAEIQDNQGDRYIVSHEQLTEMLEDESFQQDVKDGNARVELNYNKKAGENLGNISKKLLSLNKNYNEGLREYGQSEKNLNAIRQKLGLPQEPTSSTTIDGLIGQNVTYSVDKFPSRIRIKGKLEVQNGQLVIVDNDNGGILRLGKAKEFVGVEPSFLNIQFEPQKYEGPKMTSQEAKLPSLLVMFAGKVEPKTLVNLLSNVISDVKKAQLTKMVKAFDSAYQRKMQQKSINESLPKPNKLVEVEQPEVGTEYGGDEVASNVAQVGDKTSQTLLGKIMSFVQRDFMATTIDLDDLHENNEEFRNRVEQERGEKVDRFKTDYSNSENVPAVLVNGKVEDGMGRLARLYLNGQKTATVFENIKTKENATTKVQRKVQATGTESNISEPEGTQAEQEQEADEADASNSNILGNAVTVEPAIAKITSENINDVYKIKGNSTQRKVLNDIKKVVTALKNIVNLTVNVHNQESFTKALLEAGGNQEDALARGFYMSADGSIHLNLDTVKSDTMLHEGFHPLLDYIALKNKNFIKNIFKQLEAMPEAKSIIDFARQAYDGETTQMKEAITDFVAGVADGRVVINPTNFQKIKAFVLNVLKKLGLGEGMIVMNVEGKPELIKLANFVTEKFRGGEKISIEELDTFMSNPSGYQDADGNNISNGKIQLAVNNDFSDVKTKTTFSYIANKEDFEKLKKDKFITEDKVLDDFVGKKVMLHSPDNAFTGQILSNGTVIVEGKGGVFYPIRFHEDGYFWASTSSAAKSMANMLNQMLKENGGTIYMALVSSPSDKLLSSTTASNGIVEMFTSPSFTKETGLNNTSIINALTKASSATELKKTKKKDKNKNDILDKDGSPVYVTKKIGLNIKIPKSKLVDGVRRNTTIDEIKAIVSKNLSPDESTFEDRKLFSSEFISNIVDQIKGKVSEQTLGQFFDKGIENTSFKQQGNLDNKYKLSKTNLTQSISEMLSEPMLKNSESGQVYAILEINGQVEPIESKKHESYPMAIRSKEGNKTTIHILQERENWSNRFADPKTGERVQKERMLNVFPTSGVSTEALTVLPKQVSVPQLQKVAATDIINGFYSPIEDRINSFKQPKASVNKWKEIIGIKSDEAVFSGMADYLNELKPDQQLSKDDVLKFIKDNRIKINTVSRGGDYIVYNPKTGNDIAYFNNSYDAYAFQSEAAYEGDNYEVNEPSQYLKTIYEEYQLPGGNNYQEVLITLPGKDQFRSSHFDETNIITHLRMNTRTDADGKKVLFLEEVQSDWGQKGKREGFDSGRKKGLENQRKALREDNEYRALQKKYLDPIAQEKYSEPYGRLSYNKQMEVDFEYFQKDKPLLDKIVKAQKKLIEDLNNIDNEIAKLDSKENIPTAPFVTNTNAWVKLGLKFAIKEAINQGADKIAWITGEQQNDRYDLSKSIKRVDFIRIGNDRYKYEARGLDGKRIAYDDNGTTSLLDIENMFGKDIAEKVKIDKTGDIRLQGDGLKVGGKGMKAFYGDVKNPGIVANVAKALVKELTGGKGDIVTSKIEIDGKLNEQPAIDITTDLKQSVKGGMPQFQKATPTKSKLQAIKNNPLFADLSDTQAERLAKGVTIWQQWATSYGLLGKEAKIAEEYKVGYVSQEMYKADKAVKNVVKQLDLAKKSGIIITDDEITQFITGNSVPKSLTKDVKLALGVMRTHIDAMTEELILNGAITDPQEIQDFRDNKGKYLGRFYDMFLNGKGLTLNNIVDKLKDVDQNVIDRAYTLIRAEIYKGIKKSNPNLSQADLNKVVDNNVEDILNSIVEYTSNPYAKTPIKGSVNMKALMARQDIVEPIRALMGEIRNPISRYYATVAKMATVAGGIRYLNTIREIGMGNFFFEDNDPNRPKGTVKISSESNKNLAPIAGLYTFPEIRDEFNNYMMSTGKDNSMLEKAMGTAKYMNTVGNLPTHVKNFTSNIGILVNNGYITDIPNAIQFIINEPDAFKRAYEELRKSGTLNNNINATELRSYFEKNNDIDKVLSNKFKKQNVIKKGREALTAIYNVEDDVFKVLSYIIESQRYSKALFKTSFSNLSNTDKDIVSAKSIEIVKSILPLFSRVPPLIKGMNKFLYLGTFMSYTAESIRISRNTVLLAAKELANENTRLIGAKRLLGVITWNSVYGYATVSSAAGIGAMATGAFSYWYNAMQQLMSDDDDAYKKKVQKEKDIRRIVRNFNVPSDVYFTQASDGRVIYHDIGSINPYQFITNFLNRFDQLAKDEEDGYLLDFVKAAGGALYPFVKTDFIADRFITVFQALFSGDEKNIPVDAYGNKIYKQLDNAYEKYYKLGKYAAGAFTPGMVKNVSRAVDLLNQNDAEGAKAEVISTLTVRKNVIDVGKWFYTELAKGNQPLNEGISEQAKEYSKIAFREEVSNEEKEKQYQESVSKIKIGLNEISKNFKAALNNGVTEEKLVESMMMAKMREENIAAIIESLTMDIDKIDTDLILMRKH